MFTSVPGSWNNFILKIYIGTSRNELTRSRFLASLYATCKFDVPNSCPEQYITFSPLAKRARRVLKKKGSLPCLDNLLSVWGYLGAFKEAGRCIFLGVFGCCMDIPPAKYGKKGDGEEKVWMYSRCAQQQYFIQVQPFPIQIPHPRLYCFCEPQRKSDPFPFGLRSFTAPLPKTCISKSILHSSWQPPRH